jgi:hypothetical protein
VAKATNRRLFDPELYASIHLALCNAELVARGREEDRDGNIVKLDCKIPTDLWRQMSGQEFTEDHARPRFVYQPSDNKHWSAKLYFASIVIAANDLDGWVSRQAPKRKQSIVSNETNCEKWLLELASSAELFKPLPETQTAASKEHWWGMAFRQFPGLRRRQFERAWNSVAKDFPKMSDPGRKRKSRRKSAH